MEMSFISVNTSKNINISYGSIIWESQNVVILCKYKKKIWNKIQIITRKTYTAEQNEVAKAAKTNPKKFWAYIKNKTALKSTTGDKKIDNGNKEITVSTGDEKVSVFCKYFSSIFTVEDDSCPQSRVYTLRYVMYNQK